MRKKNDRALSRQGPRLGRNSSKGARTTALRPPSCIGAQTYSSETHSGGSHVCRHQQGVDPCRYAPPFLQPNEVLGGAGVQATSCNICVFSLLKWVVRVHTRTSPAGLGSLHGKTPQKSCSHCAPVGVIELFDMGITTQYGILHASDKRTQITAIGCRSITELPYTANKISQVSLPSNKKATRSCRSVQA